MNWSWSDLEDVPQPVYDELIAVLQEEQQQAARRR